ncbi:alpha/beta fold hydrolase [Novosphingobium lentum]|uniref:alpha/beta fold hydrolase n=1 Tax=Novosphingobium lentum TaxID=145287 RepID=UPI000832F9E1|nr:alpha/beta hydrolase [Novosphingobium lentum]
MADFEDRSWSSRDGLRLHYRDYAGQSGAGTGDAARPPVICLPGLTRNARDFEELAAHLAGSAGGGWRVLCPEMRGRGDSDYARDPMSYNPLQYVDDIAALLEDQAIDRFVAIGTSLGGLMTMLLAVRPGVNIAGAVINDIGPELDPKGIARIRDYVGQGRNFETWMHAARALQESQADVYPHFQIADWLRYAKRLMVLGTGGRIAFDYDMKIAEPFAASNGEPGPDMWPLFDALAASPLLVLRGENSDILSVDVAARMIARAPGMELVTIAGTGHAPTLDEPQAVAAIERLLSRIA